MMAKASNRDSAKKKGISITANANRNIPQANEIIPLKPWIITFMTLFLSLAVLIKLIPKLSSLINTEYFFEPVISIPFAGFKIKSEKICLS